MVNDILLKKKQKRIEEKKNKIIKPKKKQDSCKNKVIKMLEKMGWKGKGNLKEYILKIYIFKIIFFLSS